MAARRDSVGGIVPHHPRREAGNAEAERAQDLQQHAVVLEAIAAAPRLDQLVLQQFDVEPDRQPQQRIQILERDRLRMQELDRAQRLQRRCARPVIADADEIGIEVEGPVGVHLHVPQNDIFVAGTAGKTRSTNGRLTQGDVPMHLMFRAMVFYVGAGLNKYP